MSKIIYHVGRQVFTCYGEGKPVLTATLPDAASAQAEAVIRAARAANMED